MLEVSRSELSPKRVRDPERYQDTGGLCSKPKQALSAVAFG